MKIVSDRSSQNMSIPSKLSSISSLLIFFAGAYLELYQKSAMELSVKKTAESL